MSKILNGVWIDKITVVYLEPNEMEEVNLYCDIYPDHEVNFVDRSMFADIEELRSYVDTPVFESIMRGDIDYVVFRLDI